VPVGATLVVTKVEDLMSRSFVRSFVLAATLVGCVDPQAAAVREDSLVGGERDTVPMGGATLRLRSVPPGTTDISLCMATRVAPDWVMTAGHCVKYFAADGARATSLRASTDEDPSVELALVRPDLCFVQPQITNPVTTARCEDVPVGMAAIRPSYDLALLHVPPVVDDERWARLPIRPLRTARVCPDVPFAARVRGQQAPEAGLGVYSGRLGLGTATLSGGFGIQYNNIVGDQLQGDSGGPLTAAGSDGFGPVLGVLSKIDLATSNAAHAPTSSEENLAWIWSVIDGSGVCVRGSTEPCVLRVAGVPPLVGDGICSGSETIETAPTDCGPALVDSDRDGLPDARDLCPEVPLIVGDNHVDSDGDNVGDECERFESIDVCGNDLDFDGAQDDIDNCPERANADQADCDGVGPGDACDPNDIDGDRVPDQCDNCPQQNPDQRNCNFDAEEAAGITHTPGDMGLGDLCDPNPCPDGTMGLVAREFVRRDPLVPPVTVASSAAFAGTGRQTSADGAYDTPTGIRTSFRWCPCEDATADDFDLRDDCRSTSQCEIRFARLDDPPDGTWGWRVPSVQYPGSGASGLDPTAPRSPYGACVGRDVTLRPAQCIATYNPEAPPPRDVFEWVDHFRGSRPLSFVAYWDFETDARAVGALTEGPGGSRSTQGVYWYRANEYEGKPAFVTLLPPESCNRVGGCPTAGAGGEFTFASDLTSHYSSGRIDAIPTGPVARPLAFLGWWIASRAACATCASSFPRPPLTQVRCPSAACSSPEIFGRLNGTRELALAPLFTAQALTVLREPGVLFVHASEVADERPESGIPFVTVDEATLALRTVFTDASGSLGVFQGQGGPNDGPFAALRGASPDVTSGGALPLLVGETGTLYRIGGFDAGVPRPHFERLRLATRAVSQIGVLGAVPEEVLAVTLDSGRHEAIVLDRVAGGPLGRAHEQIRILRLGLESGRSQVVVSARSFRAFTNHYLAQAPGGSFVLGVSRRGRSAGYRLVHFTLPVEPGPVTVIGSYVAHGRNLEGPIVAESMGVNVAETGSPWRPVGVRWLDFRERRDRGSDFDDCF
jgi:hypothetical protein